MVLLPLLKLGLVTLNTIVMAPAVVASAVFDERAAYRLCQIWAWNNLVVCGVRVHVQRLAKLDPRRPYVFMSNHRSQYDILAVVEALPEFQLRWVAKKELTRIPIFGWALERSGHIVIDRSDHAQSVASLRAARTQTPVDVELQTAEDRVVEITLVVMGSFGLKKEDGLHALRGLRSIVHGFATLEVAGGFGLPLDCDESFRRLVELFIRGLRQVKSEGKQP